MLNSLASKLTLMAVPQDNQCVPNNTTFTDALAHPFNILIGGVGGIALNYLPIIALVVILVRGLVSIIRSRSAHEDISALSVIGVLIAGVILMILIIKTVIVAINSLC